MKWLKALRERFLGKERTAEDEDAVARAEPTRSESKPASGETLPAESEVASPGPEAPEDPPAGSQSQGDRGTPAPDRGSGSSARPPLEEQEKVTKKPRRRGRTGSVRRRRTPIVVGFDYGTAFTKILVRERGSDEASTLLIEDPQAGQPWFASPSLVGKSVDGQLFFGGRALKENDLELHRELKIGLLPPTGPGAPWHDPSVPAHDDVETNVLVAAYLAWAMGRVRDVLSERYGVDGYRVSLNMAAPMNHLSDEQLYCRYLRIVQAAWAAAFGDGNFQVAQGISLANVRSWAEPLMTNGVEIQPRAVRTFEVLPETIATLTSLALDPRVAAGRFLVVDVGAGTTEMSINEIAGLATVPLVTCYFDESSPFGVRDFREAERLGRGCAPLLGRLVKDMQRVWGVGYRKDSPDHQKRESWSRLTLLMAGGGCLRNDVRKALKKNNPIYFNSDPEQPGYVTRPHRPTGIRFDGAPQKWDRKDLQLLAVAHGLSVHRQDWLEWRFPDGVDTRDPTDHSGGTPYWMAG